MLLCSALLLYFTSLHFCSATATWYDVESVADVFVPLPIPLPLHVCTILRHVMGWDGMGYEYGMVVRYDRGGDYWILLTRKYLWINGKYGYSTLGTHESTHIHITHTCIYIYM